MIKPMVNVKPEKFGKTTRMTFSKINEVMQMPNLIEIQKASYQWFLDEGLKEVFKDIVIINPYVYFVINFLKNSNFYKRDFDK